MLRSRTLLIAAAMMTVGAILSGAGSWHAFTVALAKTDSAESWATIGQNLSRSGRYLVTSTPRVAAQPLDPPAAGAEQAARLAAALAPFTGGWAKHGYSLAISPDGSGEAVWRTYQWCKDPGVKPPCDSIGDSIIQGGGHAVLTFSSVEERTAYGSMIDISDPAHTVRLSVSLTLQPEGTALLRSGDEARVRMAPSSPTSAGDGRTLCRPEAWQTDWCGA